MKYFGGLVFLFFFNTANALLANAAEPLRVFVDCSNDGNCFPEFVRQEISIVKFVRDRTDADIHIISTTQVNASGAAKRILQFIGRNNFAALFDTVIYNIPAVTTDDESRNLLVKYLKVGLIPYLSRTSQISDVNISFKNTAGSNDKNVAVDPWNYWVFQISANGNVDGNQNYFSGGAYFSVDINKETDQSKSNIYINNSQETQKYRDENGKEYKFSFQNYGAGIQHKKKMSEHLAIGVGADASNSLFGNYKYQFTGSVNSEFSIFPYKLFNNKRWVFAYEVGPVFNKYYDTTLYLKTTDFIFKQTVGSIFSFIQPWGSTNVGVFWSNLLHDFTKNNLSLNGAISIKITKGLNFAIWGNYNFVHDQINIRKGEVDISQLLVKNRELLSSYNYNLGVGVSYRFGSKFNSAVNPTFRGLNYSINL